MKRKAFIKYLSGSATGMLSMPFIPKFDPKPPVFAPIKNAVKDELFWESIKGQYRQHNDGLINLNNGAVSPQPIIVEQAHIEHLKFANEGPSHNINRVLKSKKKDLEEQIASFLGCSTEEIVLNRNATEGLETIIYGLPLQEGDEAIISCLDYPPMRDAFYQRAAREKIKVIDLDLPVDYEDSNEIVAQYKDAISPRTKVILITHIIHYTGLIMPVKEITEMAHNMGVEVIVDGAHSFAHLNYSIEDMGCDYFATSLHKWLCAPFGTGLMYIKKEKISKIWPLFAAEKSFDKNNIDKFKHLGTYSIPKELAIKEALDFHNEIGSSTKEDRLKELKSYWLNKVIHLDEVSATIQERNSAGIAHIRFNESIDPATIYTKLWKEHGIYTMRYKLENKVDGIRISPNIFTTKKELDYFVECLEKTIKS